MTNTSKYDTKHGFTKATTFLTIIFMSFTLLSTGVAAEDTLTVNPDDDIQEAIDDADPEDVIEFESGDYEESIAVATEGLTLQSENQHEAVIKEEFRIEADDVTVEGFEFNHDQDDRGIKLDEGSNLLIENNLIEDFTTGVSMDFAGDKPEDVEVRNNEFIENNAAVGSTEDVKDLKIEQNSFTNNDEGIGLGPGAELDEDIQTVIGNNNFELDLSNQHTVGDYRETPKVKYGAEGELLVQEGDNAPEIVENAQEGATVRVHEGTYDVEEITIDTEELTLEGVGSPLLKNEEDNTDQVISVEAEEATVTGFDIERKSGEEEGIGQGIRVSASEAVIEENTIVGGGNDKTNNGITVRDADESDVENVVVRNNEITGFPVGVGLASANYDQELSDVRVNNNTMSDNKVAVGVTEFGEGVGVPQDLSLTSNDISDNEVGLKVFDDTKDNDLGVASPEEISLNENQFSNNALDVRNQAEEVLDATENYWNNPTGLDSSQFEGDVDWRPYYPTEQALDRSEAFGNFEGFVESFDTNIPNSDSQRSTSEIEEIAEDVAPSAPASTGVDQSEVESIVEDALTDREETIEAQQEVIESQEETIEAQQEELESLESRVESVENSMDDTAQVLEETGQAEVEETPTGLAVESPTESPGVFSRVASIFG